MLSLTLPAVGQAQRIRVKGSDVVLAGTEKVKVGADTVEMILTGEGLREKWMVNVYAIGSYIKKGARVTRAGLAAAKVPKMLLLVMERDVDRSKMVSAFKDAIEANYSLGGWSSEVGKLESWLKAGDAKEGEKIRFIFEPGVGVHCVRSGRTALIQNPKFGKVIWDIYLGRKNVDGDIKTGLTRRL